MNKNITKQVGKRILAVAIAAAAVIPAAAMADTSLYGNINMSYDVLGGDNAADTSSGFSSNSSFIGVKGSEKLRDNLSLIYQYETEFDVGTTTGSNGGLGNQRNTYIGVKGDFGTVIAGRHDTPFKMMGSKYDLFRDTIADSRNMLSGPAGYDRTWDLRPAQTIAYASPDIHGAEFKVAYVGDWSTDPNVGFTSAQGPYTSGNRAFSLSASYQIADFSVDAAYEHHKLNSSLYSPTEDSASAYRLGGTYSRDGVKVMGLYQDIQHVAFSAESQRSFGVGAAYSMGSNTFKAQYLKANNVGNTDNTGGDLWAVGYDYSLSKQTTLYAVYARSNNADLGNYGIMSDNTGHGNVYPVDAAKFPGGKTSAVSFGVQHKF